MISIVRATSAAILLSAVLGLSATRAWTGDINVLAYAHVDRFMSDAGDPKFEIEPSTGGCGPAPADEMECGDGD
jgi:hypothetical protein